MMKSRPSTARTKTRRIGIPIRLVVSLTSLLTLSTILNVNVKSMPLSSPSILIPSLATATAQMDDQDQQTKPSSPTSSSTSQGEFRIAYLKLGVLSANYLRILYDSETNSLTLNNISAAINKNNDSGRFSASQAQSQSQSNKQISDSDQKNL
jgi:hypothetical protein